MATDAELLDHFLRAYRTDDFLPNDCPLCAEIKRRLDALGPEAERDG
jgi:hypothetical protein